MGWLIGKRTYLAGAALIFHQVLKMLGLDLPSENVSITLDTLLAAAAVIFRSLAPDKQQPVEK